jgi:hypothetical protein
VKRAEPQRQNHDDSSAWFVFVGLVMRVRDAMSSILILLAFVASFVHQTSGKSQVWMDLQLLFFEERQHKTTQDVH